MKWNLDGILKENKFDQLYREIETDLEKFKILIADLDPAMSAVKFKDIIDFSEAMANKFSRLAKLPELKLTINSKNQKARLMQIRSENLGLKITEETIKFTHWLKGLNGGLDDDNAQRLFKTISDLEYSLNYSRKAAKYTLSEKEEKIILNKSLNLGGALSDLKDLIETEFQYCVLGKKVKTQAELLTFTSSPKAEERKAAYQALLNKQKENIDKFFVLYQSTVRDWTYEARIRHYSSPIAMRNFDNEIDDDLVDLVLTVTQKNKKIFYPYFMAKAKKLGSAKLNRFDLYAPIDNNPEIKTDLPQAIKLVLNAFNEFSPRFAAAASRIISQNHLDSSPAPGKKSGAFCAPINNEIDPYVMLNYTGRLRDITTLAHELGHSIHQIYAAHHYSAVQSAGLPLAETASTFGEMLVFEKLKKEMLWKKIDDLYATVLRQNYFVLFEKEAYQAINQGITEKELSTMYLNNLKDQFGDNLVIPDNFRYEWSYVTHLFETPFYCYAYNFGQLLSLSLYSEYKKDKNYAKVIEAILAAGGSQDPVKLLLDLGINIKQENFWQNSFDFIKSLIREIN